MSENYTRQYLRIKELMRILEEDLNGVGKIGSWYTRYTVPVKEIELIRSELMKLKKMLMQEEKRC